jgi:hypothetical protein
MTLSRVVRLAAILVIVGLIIWVLWSKVRDAGIAVSCAFALIYVVLWTMGLPRKEWVLIDSPDGEAWNQPMDLKAACETGECGNTQTRRRKRHVHFAEIVALAQGEALARRYGFVKISETLLLDLKYQWLFGVLTAGMAATVFAVASSGADPGRDFDFGRAVTATAISAVQMFTSGYMVVWFRKQSERLAAPVRPKDSPSADEAAS